MAAGDPVERGLHVLPGPVDQSEFARIRAALDSEVLFPQLPWELRNEEGRSLIVSARGVVLAEVHEASAAHLLANAPGMWLMLLGLIPFIEKRDPVLGGELVSHLQYFLGMQTQPTTTGGASQCDANSGSGDGQ